MFINRIGAVGGVRMIDAQVAASADDGNWSTTLGSFANNNTTDQIGLNGYMHIFARWTSITIPAGAIIKNSYVKIYVENSENVAVSTTLFFNDIAIPTSPTSYSTAGAKVSTTEHVHWTLPAASGWAQSDDISAIIQELMTSYTSFANGSMMMLLFSDLSDADYNDVRTYDYAGNLHGAKLHIEW